MAATSKKRTKKRVSKKTARKAVKKKTARKKAVKTPGRARKTAAKKAKTGRKAATKKAKTTRKTAKKVTKKRAPAKKATKKRVIQKKSAKKPVKKSKKRAAKKTASSRTTKKSVGRKVKTARPVRAKRAAKLDEMIHGIAPYRASRGEEYMNPQQIEHFREILSAWRQELVGEINRTIHSMQDETVNHPDPNDRATQETDMSLELRSRDRERKLIKKIDDTVAMIDGGEYGYCVNCGVEVGIARLEARPTANLCIDCKTLDEIREKQMI